MKNVKLFLFALIILSGSIVNAQWVQTGGPIGSIVQDIIAVGSNMFAATSRGIYVSSNNGTNWNISNTGLTNININRMASSGSNIFAGSGDGVFLSTNNGANWTAINSGLTNTYIRAFLVDGTKIYAGTQNGIFVTTNSGTNWSSINSGIPVNTAVTSLAIIGSNLFACTYDKGVFISTNGGAAWTAINSGLSNLFVKGLYVDVTKLYAACSPGLFVSEDNGANWALVNGLNKTCESIAINGTNMYAAVNQEGIYHNPNNGPVWTNKIFNPYPSSNYQKLFQIGSNLYVAAGSYGIYRSTDNGTTWTALNDGMFDAYIKTMSRMGSKIFAGAYYSDGVFFSSDNGSTWNRTGILPPTSIYAIVNDGSNVFVGTGIGLYKSGDNGTNWTASYNGLSNLLIYALLNNGTNLFAGTGGAGVFLSTDNGSSWVPANAGLTSSTIYTLLSSGSNLFAGTSNNGIYLSTNNGTSWTPSSLPGKNIITLKQNNNKLYAGTWGEGVWYSFDNGNSWTQIKNGMTNLFVYSIAFDSANNIYVAAGPNVYFSRDNGTNWTAMNTGMPTLFSPDVWSLEIVDNFIFAGTGGSSIWKRPLTDFVTDIENQNIVPQEFSLEQNYPNPFNPSTTIRYQISAVDALSPVEVHVTLKVYDVLGREVATLVNEYKPAGSYNYQLSTDHFQLPSGVYFYRLQAGNYSDTKKFVLMK